LRVLIVERVRKYHDKNVNKREFVNIIQEKFSVSFKSDRFSGSHMRKSFFF